MTITITNLTVAANAPAGTIVGVLSAGDVGSIIPCNFILSKKASGYFAISTNNLITLWSGSIAPGYYPVRVRAVGTTMRFSGNATFIINITDPPSLPTPTGIVFVTTTTSLPDNSPAGTTVATLSVATSDGSPFTGTLGTSPAGIVTISGSSTLVLARALSSTDDGSHQWGVTATQNGVTVSSSVTVQVIRPSQPPPAPPPALSTWSATDHFSTAYTLSNGNLTVTRTGGGNWVCGRANTSQTTGLRYFEIGLGSPSFLAPPWAPTGSQQTITFGIMNGTENIASNLWYVGQDSNGRGVATNGITNQCSGLVMPWLPANSTLAIAVDFTHTKVWFGAMGFTTWNPNSGFSNTFCTVSGGGGQSANRTSGGGNWTGFKASTSKSSGLLHVEMKYSGTPSTNAVLGFTTSGIDFTGNLVYPGQDTSKGFGYQSNGTTYGLGGISMPSCSSGDVVAWEIDFTNSKVWVQNNSNGKWNNDVIGNQNPATNTGGASTSGISGALFPSAALFSTTPTVILNCDGSTSGSFSVTPASGFSAWEPAAFQWNNDVIGNQNPASNVGGIDFSGISGAIYPAVSVYGDGLSTAQFDKGTGFVLTSLGGGATDWDGTLIVPAPLGGQAAVSINIG
jgi:hypothetical protein